MAVARGRRGYPLVLAKGYTAVTPRLHAPLLRKRGETKGEIQAERTGISVAGEMFGIYGVRFLPLDRAFRIGDLLYSGVLEAIRQKDGSLVLIEEVGVEDYLKGVLPQELPALWPDEILKAQAVLSRTFALYKALCRQGKDYDLVVEGWAQRYGGQEAEHAKSNRAIAATRDEVLAYRGKLFLPYFHANSGGRTTGPETLWEASPHPVFAGVDSHWSLQERHANWSLELTRDKIADELIAAGYRVGRVSDLRITDRDRTGRVVELKLRHQDGELKIGGNAFRIAMGADALKSTLFNMQQQDTSIVFNGRGWGHGVGLCQWGAKALADEGKTYREILRLYFPGCEIRKISNP
ncbi:MAG: SpoIID/LytB domain-containing protein [Kiritimatiellae bacterium]|nr:SpoIID/LytB domain-containing protein [Kiritimatiellia bacterium]